MHAGVEGGRRREDESTAGMVVHRPSHHRARFVPTNTLRLNLRAIHIQLKRHPLARPIAQDDRELSIGLSNAEIASGERVHLKGLTRSVELKQQVVRQRHAACDTACGAAASRHAVARFVGARKVGIGFVMRLARVNGKEEDGAGWVRAEYRPEYRVAHA